MVRNRGQDVFPAAPAGFSKGKAKLTFVMSLLNALIFLAAVLSGWTLGANDAANSMGTAVGAKVRTVREAVVMVGACSLAGALVFGNRVIDTIGKGIVPLDQLDAHLASVIALSAILASSAWLFSATYLKLPVSTTHAIVGAVAGAGLAVGNVPIYWEKLVDIVMAWMLTPVGAAVLGYVLYQALRFLVLQRFHVSDRLWAWLLTLSGMYMAFSWGANDVANATGVLVGVGMATPFQAAALGGIAIVLGIAMWGYRVMETVGSRITNLLPSMAFVAEIAASLNVHLYTLLGLPVSTTHSIVGAIFGVGLVFGRRSIDMHTARDIVLAWAATPAASGVVSFVLYFLLSSIV